MLYILCALKPEAQAFIDKYKLKKQSLKEYKIFTNQDITLIISGVGNYNAMYATQTLINHFDITDDDIYLNIGICGASTQYEIGELINISYIDYKDKNYLVNNKEAQTIRCCDKAISKDVYPIVDMESFGFYDAIIHSPAIKHRYIFKIVSDHFEPHCVTKDKTKSLIFKQLDKIEEILTQEDL